jgi:hypothetical protein
MSGRMCAILGRKRPSRRGTVNVVSMTFVVILLVMQSNYHLSITSLFRSIDEGFCNRLTPVDASAEDVEEESFELVCFGHCGVCTVQGRRRLCGIKVIGLSQFFNVINEYI